MIEVEFKHKATGKVHKLHMIEGYFARWIDGYKLPSGSVVRLKAVLEHYERIDD